MIWNRPGTKAEKRDGAMGQHSSSLCLLPVLVVACACRELGGGWVPCPLELQRHDKASARSASHVQRPIPTIVSLQPKLKLPAARLRDAPDPQRATQGSWGTLRSCSKLQNLGLRKGSRDRVVEAARPGLQRQRESAAQECALMQAQLTCSSTGARNSGEHDDTST